MNAPADMYMTLLKDPDNGVDAGTSWDDLPEDWVCPLCGAAQEDFEKLDD